MTTGTTWSRAWRERLLGRMPGPLAEEIDIFETQMELRRQGRIDEKLFAESRLRRGIYGQRYDNGQRHDGVRTQTLSFPCGELTKGTQTVWDAPGMMRIKLPLGRVSAEQIELMADLAEEYADSILHVTTRQDIQLHFVHIEDTPALMRRLAAVGITTREACGNSVRNVTTCQFAGVCGGAPFDPTPYAHALTYFLLGHKDTQDFGRKLKVAFSGCRDEACGLLNIHDLGLLTVVRDGRRGFEVYVGGGLGSVPRPALLLTDFCTEQELLPLSQAICRVFARHGEKAKRNKARLKFLVEKLGIDEFRRLVFEERAVLPPEDRWTSYLGDLGAFDEAPLRPASTLEGDHGPVFAAWRATNVRPQAQPGYVTATVRLPLGDMTSWQARGLADLARRFTGDHIRLTIEQNVVFRWVAEGDLPAFHQGLEALGVADAGAGTVVDVVSCPGTDTCKLGISSSRGLGSVLQARLAAKADALHPDVRKLHIKASGCFNSCGQHHVADIGFLGVSRNVGGRRVAHFQLVVGGEWTNNGGAYGLAIGAYPSKNVPAVVDRLTSLWIAEREGSERFQAFVGRVGRARVKEALEDLTRIPPYHEDPSFYTDWGDAREYTVGDMGVGECAGEVVSSTQFGLADAEREAFQAQLALERGDAFAAATLSVQAMYSAVKALIRLQFFDVKEDADSLAAEFRARLHDTGLFRDPFMGDKFAQFFFKVHEEPPAAGVARDEAHRQIEEATLFIEAAHACYDRMQEHGRAN